MELTFLEQTQSFMYSLLLGLITGVVYGVFKIIRISFCKGRVSVFLLDFIFMLGTFLSIYVFSIAFQRGFVRIFLIVGVFLSFFVYRITAGRFLSMLYVPAIRFFQKITEKILLKFKKIAKKLLKIGYKILYNIINSRSIYRRKNNPDFNKDRMTDVEYDEKKEKVNKKSAGSRSGGKKRNKGNKAQKI